MGLEKDIQDLCQSLYTNSDFESAGIRSKKINTFLKLVLHTYSPDVLESFIRTGIANANYFTSKIFLRIVNHCHHLPAVLEIFTKCDKNLIAQVINFPWLYNGSDSILEKIEPTQFVSFWIPQVSYSSRLKLMHRLGLQYTVSEKLDLLYETMKSTYGIDSAAPLLPGCSEKVLKSECIDRQKPIVFRSSKQLKYVASKHPCLLIDILNKNHNQYISFRLHEVVDTLMKLEKSKFLDFLEQADDDFTSIKFGKTRTKKLIAKERERLLKHPKIYLNLLHSRTLFRKMSNDEFTTMLKSILPEDVSDCCRQFRDHWSKYEERNSFKYWFGVMEHKKIFPLFENAFIEKYGQRISNFPGYFTFDKFLLLSDTCRAQVITQLQTKANDDSEDEENNIFSYGNGNSYCRNCKEEFWTIFLPVDVAMSRLKEFCTSEPDVDRRTELISLFVLNCVVNNEDLNGLALACELVTNRFRNDQPQVRGNFLALVCIYFPMKTWTANLWKWIMELWLLAMAENNVSSPMMKILSYVFEHEELKLPTMTSRQAVKIMSERQIGWLTKEQFLKNPHSQKETVLTYMACQKEKYLGKTNDDHNDLYFILLEAMQCMQKWNQFHKKNIITLSEFPWSLTEVKQVLKKDYRWSENVKLVTRTFKSFEQDVFAWILKDTVPASLFLSVLQVAPQQLLEDLPNCTPSMLKADRTEFIALSKKLKKQGYVKLCEKIVSYCLEVATNDDEIYAKGTALLALSILMEPNEFIKNHVQPYYPNQPKFSIEGEESVSLMETVKILCKSLANINPPNVAVDSVAKFCCGDYLKSVVGSLASIAMNLDASNIVPVLQTLVDRPVSVKKHAIRFLSLVSNLEENNVFLQSKWATEKHTTTRGVILRQMLCNFVEQPTQQGWSGLKEIIASLTPKDGECFDFLIQKMSEAPVGYIFEYLTVCWNQISVQQSKGYQNLKRFLSHLLNMRMENEVEKFVKQLLTDKWLKKTEGRKHSKSYYRQMAVEFLLQATDDDVNERVKLVSSKLINSPNYFERNDVINEIQEFVDHICAASFKNDCKTIPVIRTKIFKELALLLEKKMSGFEFVVELMYVSLSIIMHNVKTCSEGNPFIQAGNELCTMVNKWVDTYGSEMIYFFAQKTVKFLLSYNCCPCNIPSDHKLMLLLAKAIIYDIDSNSNGIIFAAMLIQKDCGDNDTDRALKQELHEKLKEFDLKQVNLLLRYK